MTYILFLVILFLWLISGILFPFDSLFYYSLNLPKFTPPSILFAIIWPILYFLLTLSFFIILKKDKVNRHYLFAYILNYILNQSFSLFFFYQKNLILTFYDIILLLFSIIYLLKETKKVNKISFYLLLPYLLWTIFATILFGTIYFIN